MTREMRSPEEIIERYETLLEIYNRNSKIAERIITELENGTDPAEVQELDNELVHDPTQELNN